MLREKQGCVRHSYTSRISCFTIRETEITRILLRLFIDLVGPKNFHRIETKTYLLYAGYSKEVLKRSKMIEYKIHFLNIQWFHTNDRETIMFYDNEKDKWSNSVTDVLQNTANYLWKLQYEEYTQGLFKLENKGKEMIALALKSYILHNPDFDNARKLKRISVSS